MRTQKRRETLERLVQILTEWLSSQKGNRTLGVGVEVFEGSFNGLRSCSLVVNHKNREGFRKAEKLFWFSSG